MASLLSHITRYREQNQLEPIEYLEEIVENYLCLLPENIGGCVSAGKLKRGFFGFVKGGIALFQNVAYTQFVSKEKANARAEICVGCPMNVFPDKGPFVRWSDRLAEASVGTRRVDKHSKLGNCEACGCPLRAKVWFGGKLELTEEQEAKAPDFCWQRDKNK